jgi:hypothetical protein
MPNVHDLFEKYNYQLKSETGRWVYNNFIFHLLLKINLTEHFIVSSNDVLEQIVTFSG